MRFASHGINAFILRYSINSPFPAALLELAYAVKYVRENAEKYDIDPDKILLCGFSAGGHLTASLGTLWNSKYLHSIIGSTEMFKPNGMILCYPSLQAVNTVIKVQLKVFWGKIPRKKCWNWFRWKNRSAAKLLKHLYGTVLTIKPYRLKIL